MAAVGVDETAFLAACAGSHTKFVAGIVALPGPGRPRAQLLGVVPGRTGSVVQQWISAQDAAWREQVTTASLDPFRGYATALRTSLPDAVRVLDAFHVVRLGQAASTTSAVGGSRRPSAGEGIARTRSAADGGCCAAASPR